MKIWEISEYKVELLIPQLSERIDINKINKEQIFSLMNSLFENCSDYELASEDDFNNVKDPVKREISIQINKVLCEFVSNIDEQKRYIKQKFPSL